MRKKQWLILSALIAIIIAFVVYSVYASPTAQFETAKKIAIASVPDKDGDYIVGRKIIEGGVQKIYIVGYFPRIKNIGGCIVIGDKMLTVIYNEDSDSYGAAINNFQTGKLLASNKMSKEDASEIMDNILEHLVNPGISY